MYAIRKLTTVAAVLVGGCALLNPGAHGLSDVGVETAAGTTVSLVEGTSTLQWSSAVEGAVWRLGAPEGTTSSTLAGDVLDQLEAAECVVVESLHGHGVSDDGARGTTITATHLRCPRGDVEVGWNTERPTVWVVVG